MKICVIYSSPKLGDIIFQLPFIKRLSSHYKTKVTLCINAHIGIKSIFQDQDYIEDVIENFFRRKKFFLTDHFKLYKELKNRKFDKVYILEKTKGALIASIFAGIKERYSFGIGLSRFFITNNSKNLNKEDLRYNYTEQSLKFFSKLGIENVNFNEITLKLKNNSEIEKLINCHNLQKPYVALAVDSNESNRIWPQKNFAKLIDMLIEDKLASHIFIINQKRKDIDYFKNIQTITKYENKISDCKVFNRKQIIELINFTDYFIGLDSGPSCISGALGKKTFCIIGPTDATLPRFPNMYKIISKFYDPKREVGIKRCGDNFDKTDKEVKTISVDKVFYVIKKNLS